MSLQYFKPPVVFDNHITATKGFSVFGTMTALDLFVNNVTVSSIVGDIFGSNNLRTSFNQGSATGDYSFAVGSGKAFGSYSHAEGGNTTASGNSSHAEGENTIASGLASHAEGATCKAVGAHSHAEGRLTEALGIRSHAAGDRATALHNRTWIWSVPPNDGLIVQALSTTRAGQFMVNAPGGACFFSGKVGIGTDSIDNALTVVGDISATGAIYGQGTGLDESSLNNYLSTSNVILNSVNVLENLIVYGTLSALSAEFVNITNTFVSNITSLSTLEISNTLITYGDILSGNQNLTDIFVLNSSLNDLSGNWQTAYQQISANDLVRSDSTFETPTTGISAIQNIVSLSQATYNDLTVKLPTTLYIIV